MTGADQSCPFSPQAIADCTRNTIREPRRGEQYWMGVDLARSHDWTVAIVIDQNNDVVAFDRFQAPWHETLIRIRWLASKYNNAQICVDATGLGDPIAEELQRMPYQNLAYA